MRTYYVAGIPYSDTELNHMGVSDVQWDKSDELYHHGIKGQQWYKRRFVDYDGKLTPAGRRRYGIEEFQPAALKDNAGTQNGTKQSSLKETIKRQQAAGNQYGTRFSSAQRKNHIESPVGNPNRAANNATAANNNVAAARKADMKATVAYNNSIPGRINAGINAGKEWLNQAGQNINNAASDAVNYVTGNRDYNDAMAKANNYQQQAINAGGDTKTIGDVGPNVEANKALNNAEQTMKNAENQQPGFLRDITNVGNWIGERARDAGNWVGDNLGIYNAANWVGDRARDAGNWVGDRASDVANYFTGNRDNATYNRAMEGASRLANQPGGFNASRDLEQYANSIGYQQPAFLRDVTNVGNWVGDRARDAGNWVGDRARDAGNWVGDNLGIYNAANWVGDRASDVANYFTGNRDNAAAYNNAMARANPYQQQAIDAGGDTRTIGDLNLEARKAMANANNIMNNVEYQQPGFIRDVNNAWNWVGDRASDVANYFTGNRDNAEYNRIMEGANRLGNQPGGYNAAQGMQQYADSIYQQPAFLRDVNNAWNWAGNTANTAGNWIGDRARDAGNWIGQNAQNVSNWADQTATTARARLGNVAAINTVTNNNSKVRDYSDVIQKIPLGDKETMSIYGEQSANLRNQVADAYRNNDMATVSQLVAQADALDAQINDIADFYRPKK